MKDQFNMGAPDVPLEQKTLTVVHGSSFVDLSFTNFVNHNPTIVKVSAIYICLIFTIIIYYYYFTIIDLLLLRGQGGG